jgi:mono/diheme cytochrome c family protein
MKLFGVNRWILAVTTFLLLVTSAYAETTTLGDPEAGKLLYVKKCQACHISLIGGDGTELHTRPDRRIKTAKDIPRQVKGCNHQLNMGLKPKEVQQVTSYIREAFYSNKQ